MRRESPGLSSVVVGHDMRPSGVELVAAFTDGVTSQGVDVVALGLASTDMLYYAAGVLDMPGAVFTASHNPAQYNGIKMCRAGAAPIGEESGLADIKQLVIDGVATAAATGSVTQRDMLADFAAHVHSFIDPTNLAPLKVVADTANNRVLIHGRAPVSGSAIPADAVLGQHDMTSNGENRWEAVERDTLCWPYGVHLRGNTLAIADSGNNRVTLWKRRDPVPAPEPLQGT